MKYILTTSLIAVLCASQTAALSCMRPDIADVFQNLDAAEGTYSVFMGSFEFVPPKMQPVSNDAQPQDVNAVFSGQGLGQNGFGPINPVSVKMQTNCAGPWCGGFPTPGVDVLAFVEHTPQGYLLHLGPCGGTVFDTTAAPIVEACMRGEACSPVINN